MILHKYGLYAAWVISVIAGFGTVYLTEVQHWYPCNICWYQQMCMLPLSFILGIAAWRGFFGIASYTLPISLAGLTLATYQIFSPIPVEPKAIQICNPGCTQKFIIGLGIDLSILSACSFFFISILLYFVLRLAKQGDSRENQ